MASTSKFDLSSGSPDKLTYPGGQRGGHTAASLSGSYREGVDNRILSAFPSMPRSTTTLSHGDVLNFFHGLPFDSKQLAAGHKLPRQVDLNRVMTATLGISLGDTKQLPASSLEELKRVKTNLHDNSVRARDRLKILNETASKFDKCFQNILTRKRSRSDVPPCDRANSSLSNDRTVFGGVPKMGTQSQTSALDSEAPKSEEKAKNIVPNKRTRTSLLDVQMDVRTNALGRPNGSMERDKESPGFANAGQSEEKDRMLSNSVDGWEKSRMKKKRSGIKSEISTSTVLNRPLDGDQESKRDMQQRLGVDVRSRSSSAHGFRSGPSNGIGGLGKLDVTSQKAAPGMRATPKNDQDTGCHLNDRKDHLVGLEKERVNIKSFNRSNIRENNSSSSNASIKMNTVTRAPRSGPGAVPKALPNVHRSIGVADDWELSQSTNKLHAVSGANNRKRTPSARSSSPPVAQWAGQRPQKIPRVARRSNFVPPVLGHDEMPALDTESNISGNDNGVGFQRRSSGNAFQPVKSKGEQVSSLALSESEESGAAEIKSKDKCRKSAEMDEKGGQSNPKVGMQVPSRKNKVLDEELALGGSIRRQGRTVRGFAGTRSGNPMSVGKRDSAVTAKQLRSSRHTFDKIESKTGRPPTKKLSDRRVYTRPRHSVNAGKPDFHGELVDGHEELLAAANAAINSGHACSSKFWRQMEPIFGLVSSEDITYLKQQANSFSEPIRLPVRGDDSTTVSNGFGSIEYEEDQVFTNESKSSEHLPEKFVPGKETCMPSLFQRVLSAFIVEEGDEGFHDGGQEDFEFDVFGSKFDPDEELKCDNWNQRSLDNIQTVGRPASNGHRITATRRYLDEVEDDDLECADLITDTNVETVSNYEHYVNGFQPDQTQMPSTACTQSQYNQMSIDERLLLEVQSIGIFSDPVSEDDDISKDITRLEEKLQGQVLKKKQLLCKLEKSVTEAREIQIRDVERRAFDELVRMAYEKYMTCWGPNASCGKGMSGKLAKQAALAFVNRIIERCHKFENTSESCFNEPAFLDVFHSVSSLVNAESINKDGESSKLYAETPIRSSEVTVSASLGSQPIPSLISQSGQNLDSHERCSSDDFESVNHLCEQTIGKEDAASNRMKKRELLLDDVVGGTICTSLGAPSGIGSSLLSGAKGKRSERDREGKGHSREMQSRNGTAKIGRPSMGITKGDRKSKAKPKQRTTQLSASVNGLLGKTSDTPKEVSTPLQESREMIPNRSSKKIDDLSLDTLPDPEGFDLSNLQLPEMDALGVPDDLGEQGQDLASWLNIDDDGLQDHDFMGGLEIPMDDLSDLNMML